MSHDASDGLVSLAQHLPVRPSHNSAVIVTQCILALLLLPQDLFRWSGRIEFTRVFDLAIGLTDQTLVLPIEIDAVGLPSDLYLVLRLRLRHVVLVEDDPGQRLEWRLGTRVEEVDDPSRAAEVSPRRHL